MVRVSSIDYNKLIELGFKSRTQANESFKGLRSMHHETEDQYLTRVWDHVKHVVHANEIGALIKDEEKSRKELEIELSHCMQRIRHNEREERLRGARYVELERHLHEVMEENEALINAYNRLACRVEAAERDNAMLTQAYKTSCCNVLRHNKIMELPTKRTNQCHICPICNDVIAKKETIYDSCHTFHIRCLTFWLLDNNTCPCCRAIVV